MTGAVGRQRAGKRMRLKDKTGRACKVRNQGAVPDTLDAVPLILVRRVAVRLVLVVAGRDHIGTAQPAVKVDILAARRAERIGVARRGFAAFGARAFGTQRRHRGLVARIHDRWPDGQLEWTLKPSPASKAIVSYRGRPTTLV